MKNLRRTARMHFILALSYATFVSFTLYGYGAWLNRSLDYSYLLWNLVLSCIPLVLALWLSHVLQHKLWSSWTALALSVAWLMFLPNSFYMISDYIHLQDSAPSDVLYNSVMFTSFIYTGVLLGLASLYVIHLELKLRFHNHATPIVATTLLLCSAAIYVGRDLRWNSWDIFTNPAGVLFDVSDRILHPATYPSMLLTIGSFFLLLSSIYGLVWRGSQLLRSFANYRA